MARRAVLAGVLFLGAGAFSVAGGIAGWNLYRVFGKETMPARATASTEAESKVLKAIAEMEKSGAKRFGVLESDGRLLRLLTETIGAKNIVEVGTSTGYSALWLSLGLKATGGHLTTFEVDPGRAATAQEHFQRAGVDGQVTVIVGDAHKTLARLKEPIDLVFIDADKEGYVDYAKKLLPLVREGGLVLAHNVRAAPDYVQHVAGDPDLDTVLLTRASGMSATLKRR